MYMLPPNRLSVDYDNSIKTRLLVLLYGLKYGDDNKFLMSLLKDILLH